NGAGNGGRGGNGADGGDGGGGAGAAGGLSVGIFVESGSSVTQSGNTFDLGAAGSGGLGGLSGAGVRAANGESGIQSNVYTMP
ncbi:MAG: hypothetical protein EP330_24645, partial [Deltaproteobacteria bacterium]